MSKYAETKISTLSVFKKSTLVNWNCQPVTEVRNKYIIENLYIIYDKYAMASKSQVPHTWIIMNCHISKCYLAYFHWYRVSNLRNDNVTKVRLIVNIPFNCHYYSPCRRYAPITNQVAFILRCSFCVHVYIYIYIYIVFCIMYCNLPCIVKFIVKLYS